MYQMKLEVSLRIWDFFSQFVSPLSLCSPDNWTYCPKGNKIIGKVYINFDYKQSEPYHLQAAGSWTHFLVFTLHVSNYGLGTVKILS